MHSTTQLEKKKEINLTMYELSYMSYRTLHKYVTRTLEDETAQSIIYYPSPFQVFISYIGAWYIWYTVNSYMPHIEMCTESRLLLVCRRALSFIFMRFTRSRASYDPENGKIYNLPTTHTKSNIWHSVLIIS